MSMDHDPEQKAEQQFLHGLLRGVHEDAVARERRLERLHEALREPASSPAPNSAHRTAPAAPHRTPWRMITTLAATILVGTAVFLTVFSGEAAQALVLRSIQAVRESGTRRYTVALGIPELSPLPFMTGTLDVKDSDHVLLAGRAHGQPITIGLGDEGSFLFHPDGSFEALPEGSGWPRFLDFPRASFLIEPIDDVLFRLHHEAKLELVGEDPLPGQDSPRFAHVVATTADEGSDHPGRVELWIDPDTRQVRRLEYAWSMSAAAHHAVRHRIRWPGSLAPTKDEIEPPSMPPLRMVYELQDPPELPENWFTPGPHRH